MKIGTGGSFQNEEPANTGLFLFLITVQTLGKEKNPPPSSPKSILRWFRCFVCSPSVSLASAYIPAQTCSLRLCGAHSAARRGTYVSNRAFYLRLFLISLHAFPPPFFIMLSHVNPSSSLNAVHFWVHSNVIVCCSSSLFFFLSLTFHCQRF